MLRNYMNEGGKVVFSGRNGWVQQTSTGTGLQSYSGYTWWQEPVYGFDYPADQAGDDDRPHTAFFRELDISNDWAQWWLGINGRQGGVGTTTYNAAQLRASGSGFLAGMPDIALDTTAGAGDTLEPTQNADTGADEPRAKAPTRLRHISQFTSGGIPLGRAFRAERVEADYSTATNTQGGAIISTRDAVSIGFGLEQITDAGQRNELVARMMGHLLPTTADTARADGHVAASRRRGDGQRRRPGGDRGRGRRRARRPQGGPPEHRRHAGRQEGVLPVPDALAADRR